MVKNLLLLNFIISCFVGLGVYIAQKVEVKLPLLINNYLNDFLIIPIVLTLSVYILRFTRNNKSYKIPIIVIVFLIIIYAIFFEIYMPTVSQRYTADVFDVLTYFLGGFWFYSLQENC